MLKRYQVILAEWQADYIKEVAERYDQSFSEVVRIFICEGFLYIIPLLHPEYKGKIGARELVKMTKEAGNPNISLEKRHKLVSDLYFEARKAVEYRTTKISKHKKNMLP